MKYVEDPDAVTSRVVHCTMHPEYDGKEDPVDVGDPSCMCDFIRHVYKRTGKPLLEFNCPECKELLLIT